MSQSPYSLRTRTAMQEHPYTSRTSSSPSSSVRTAKPATPNKQEINSRNQERISPKKTTTPRKSNRIAERPKVKYQDVEKKIARAQKQDMVITQVPFLILRFAIQQIAQIADAVYKNAATIILATTAVIAAYIGANVQWSGQTVTNNKNTHTHTYIDRV
jgi:hypothetical protein